MPIETARVSPRCTVTPSTTRTASETSRRVPSVNRTTACASSSNSTTVAYSPRHMHSSFRALSCQLSHNRDEAASVERPTPKRRWLSSRRAAGHEAGHAFHGVDPFLDDGEHHVAGGSDGIDAADHLAGWAPGESGD